MVSCMETSNAAASVLAMSFAATAIQWAGKVCNAIQEQNDNTIHLKEANIFTLVCRAPRKLLVLQEGSLQPENTISISDEEMFKTANVDGTGNMTLKEFTAYFDAPSDDSDLTAKFQM